MLPTLRIAGTGPVALACALFLVRRGVPPSRIILDAVGDAAAQAELPPTLARRALAISHGTRQLLERIAPMPAAGVIEEVDVSMPGRLGRTRIRASDLRVPALGYVIRYPALVRSLREAAARASWLPPNSPAPDAVIHAEGDAGENARIREFGQWALLTEVQVRAGSHVAYERFTDSGPLALLPL
ncbi:MAG TPA: hypothetical protein VM491_15215, partial [Burkholderiaceae bacterium]|nr:hypothetical protein [Burkholderiaceae bacterium]